jgi:hypothetical protein
MTNKTQDIHIALLSYYSYYIIPFPFQHTCRIFFFLKKSKWNIINQQTISSAQGVQKRISNNYKKVSTVKKVVNQSPNKGTGYGTNHESDNEKQ